MAKNTKFIRAKHNDRSRLIAVGHLSDHCNLRRFNKLACIDFVCLLLFFGGRGVVIVENTDTSPLPVNGCKFWPLLGTFGHEQWGFFTVPHLLWHGTSVFMVISKDPWHAHLELSRAFGSGAVTTCLKRLRSVAAGIWTPNIVLHNTLVVVFLDCKLFSSIYGSDWDKIVWRLSMLNHVHWKNERLWINSRKETFNHFQQI